MKIILKIITFNLTLYHPSGRIFVNYARLRTYALHRRNWPGLTTDVAHRCIKSLCYHFPLRLLTGDELLPSGRAQTTPVTGIGRTPREKDLPCQSLATHRGSQ